jgi:hypothetical protein
VRDREAKTKGVTTLSITSGRALQIIDARGNRQEITAEKGEFSKPGQLFKLEKGRLIPVDKLNPGEHGYAQHGETEWNGAANAETAKIAEKPAPGAPPAKPPAPAEAVAPPKIESAGIPPLTHTQAPGPAKILAPEQSKAPVVDTQKPATTEPLPSKQTVAKGEPGWVGNIPTKDIHVDAPRFQFKRTVSDWKRRHSAD